MSDNSMNARRASCYTALNRPSRVVGRKAPADQADPRPGMTEFRFPGTDDGSQRNWAPLPFRPAEFGLIKPTSRPGGPPAPKDILGQVPSTAEVFKALERPRDLAVM